MEDNPNQTICATGRSPSQWRHRLTYAIVGGRRTVCLRSGDGKNKHNEDVRHPTQLGKVDQIDGNTPRRYRFEQTTTSTFLLGSHLLTLLTWMMKVVMGERGKRLGRKIGQSCGAQPAELHKSEGALWIKSIKSRARRASRT